MLLLDHSFASILINPHKKDPTWFSQWLHHQSLARVKETFAHPGGTSSTLTAIFIIAGIKGQY